MSNVTNIYKTKLEQLQEEMAAMGARSASLWEIMGREVGGNMDSLRELIVRTESDTEMVTRDKK